MRTSSALAKILLASLLVASCRGELEVNSVTVPASGCKVDRSQTSSAAMTFTTNPSYQGTCGVSLNGTVSGTFGAAVMPALYADSMGCGSCYELAGPTGSAVVQVAEICYSCNGSAAFDLYSGTLATISGGATGSVPITYNRVPCPVTGNIKMELLAASNSYYVRMRFTNHLNRIAKVVMLNGTESYGMTRLLDNSFELSFSASTPPSQPYTFQLTDEFGQTITETATLTAGGGPVNGSYQFPACL